MKRSYTLWMLAIVMLISLNIQAQSYQLNNNASKLEVDGTSNIHDWTLEAQKSSGSITVNFAADKLEAVEKLEFTVVANSLMSGKSGMDKNTFEALDTDKYKNITYQMKKVKKIEALSDGKYKVKSNGILIISGKSKEIALDFILKKQNNDLVISGEHSLKMSDFGIDPPTALFGTIKTGDPVKISFTSTFNK